MLGQYTFPKAEKLTSKILIAETFKSGTQYFNYPLKVFFLPSQIIENTVSAKVLISVPKKAFKKAVQRNRIKRQLREIYRLNKPTFLGILAEKKIHCCIGIIFIAKKAITYQEMNDAFLVFVSWLKKQEFDLSED